MNSFCPIFVQKQQKESYLELLCFSLREVRFNANERLTTRGKLFVNFQIYQPKD